MPSANTVAQKPAGNFSPLSSLGQDGVLVSLPGLDWLRAGAIGSIRHNTATQDSRVLFTWSRRIEPSGDRLRKIPLTILLHFFILLPWVNITIQALICVGKTRIRFRRSNA